MKKVFCYFHRDDLDGWASSAVVKKKYPETEFLGCDYEDNDISLVQGYDIVFMVDFSVSLNKLQYLQKNNKQFIWIDHHASKIQEAEEKHFMFDGIRDAQNIHSACVLTWKFLYHHEKVPELLQYIEDIDLWKFTLYNTRSLTTCLDIEYKENRDTLEVMLNPNFWEDVSQEICEKGETYLKLIQHQILQIVKNKKIISWKEYTVVVVNSPLHRSFIGEHILKEENNVDFVVIWEFVKDVVNVSLRSRGNVNVADIARLFGGGGHQAASGFIASFEEFKKSGFFE